MRISVNCSNGLAIVMGVAVLGCGARSSLPLGDGGRDAGGASPDSSTGAEGGSMFSTGNAPPGCDAILPGPSMVEVTAPNGMHYCIDSTEVTNGQYQEFLDTAPDPAAQADSVCAFINGEFEPRENWPFEASAANEPVAWVQWCDAKAYCEAAGKRLCGRVGGGPNSPDAMTAEADEWINACSKNGIFRYPYGINRQEGTCNDNADPSTWSTAHSLPVGSLTGCEGGFPGLYDMMGNVSEWVNNCGDACWVRGSSFWGTNPENTCSDSDYRPVKDGGGAIVGFRCCRDAD